MLHRLKLWRRHTPECPHCAKGRDFLGCRCPIWVDGSLNGKRIRQSLGTRDLHRASRKLAKLEDEPKSADSQRKRQPIAHAIQAFHESTRDLSRGTKRNYVRILRFLEQFTTTRGLETIDQIDLETLNAFLLPEDQLSDLGEGVAGSATLLPFLCGLRLDREESRQARDGA